MFVVANALESIREVIIFDSVHKSIIFALVASFQLLALGPYFSIIEIRQRDHVIVSKEHIGEHMIDLHL